MNNLQKISYCLISVSDKSGIIELAKFLEARNVKIISTGGTYKLLNENKIAAIDISEFTGFSEIMDGRVKTLHPKVHGGLLGILDNKSHQKQAQENDIRSIDLLIVNLYPFVKTVAKTDDEEEIVENIDIGGPAMVRSAAKNFVYKTVVTDIEDYDDLMAEMQKNDGSTSLDFRRKMTVKAFRNIAEYDVAIAQYFEQKKSDILKIDAALKQNLRYGENAHQQAALYKKSGGGIVDAKQLQGKELSYNNLNDSDAAYLLVQEFSQPACVIIKHANPCGVAIGDDLLEVYKKALQADSKSAFGGIVALNGNIDEKLAMELSKMFYEVIIAKSIDGNAIKILEGKKNLRILIADFKPNFDRQIKSISGGFLVQDFDRKKITTKDLKQVSKKNISVSEIEQLVFAMNVCKHMKSNAILVVNNFQTVGMGAGQTSRVDACEIACKKASNFFDGQEVIDKASGSYMASDAFFPFADNIEIAAAHNIRAIVAPQGSIRDAEVIAMADQKGIALYFIETRHFKH